MMDAWLSKGAKRDRSPPREPHPEPSSQPSPSLLTPEQQAKIEANRQAALAKLANKNPYLNLELCLTDDWVDLLAPEFKLPYWKGIQVFT